MLEEQPVSLAQVLIAAHVELVRPLRRCRAKGVILGCAGRLRQRHHRDQPGNRRVKQLSRNRIAGERRAHLRIVWAGNQREWV